MATTIVDISTSLQNKTFRFFFSVDITSPNANVDIHIGVSYDTFQPAEVSGNLDWQNGNIEFITPLASVTYAPLLLCLLQCALGKALKDIYDCWKQTKGSQGDFIPCLLTKGHALSSEVTTCAIGCLADYVSP